MTIVANNRRKLNTLKEKTMTFKFNAPQQDTPNDRPASDRPQVDFKALEQHTIDTVGLSEEPESIVGIISGLYSLGKQKQQNAEEDWTGSAEQLEKLEKFEGAERTQKYGKEILTYPKRDADQITFAIDFPDFPVSKAEFFGGEPDPKPLRLVMGGEYMVNDGEKWTKILGKGWNLSITNIGTPEAKVWSFSKNSQVYKMAQAAGILRDNGAFLPEDLGNLLGKAVMFEVRIWNKPSNKDASKKYYTESIKFVGKVPRGFNVPALEDQYLHGVNFDGGNEPEHVKQLRATVKNTIKRAVNYEGSGIQKELEELQSGGGNSGNSSPQASQQAPSKQPEQTPAAPVKQAPVHNEPPELDFDSEIPF